jgi:hypothetical protein
MSLFFVKLFEMLRTLDNFLGVSSKFTVESPFSPFPFRWSEYSETSNNT